MTGWFQAVAVAVLGFTIGGIAGALTWMFL
jgi:hypothetical protein